MKKVLYLLTALSILSLSGCDSSSSKINETNNNVENKTSNPIRKGKTLTFSQFLHTGTKKKPLILYSTPIKEAFGKDSRVKEMFIFTDNKITQYNTSHIIENLGEIAQKKDTEIIQIVEQRYSQELKERIEKNIPLLKESLAHPDENNNKEYEKKATELNTKYYEELKKLEARDLITNKPFPYDVIIRTDDTGNNTLTEEIHFQYEENSIYSDFSSGMDFEEIDQCLKNKTYKKGKAIGDDTIEVGATYFQDTNFGTVYDSLYKYFIDNDNEILYFSRLDDESIQLTADEPGQKGIAVDPNE